MYKHQKNRFMGIWLVIIIVVIYGLLSFSGDQTSNQKDNYVVIPYGNFVDKSIITHSGETVGEVIQKISDGNISLKGLLQPYLEPFSILCNDELENINNNNTFELFTNIVDHYPAGSEQPAWVSLFREGHFQLYYNSNNIRIFLKGTSPERAFESFRSIIRHPIRDILKSEHFSPKKITVYTFSNDYEATEIKLNQKPFLYKVSDIDLSPKRKQLDLDSIEEFFNTGVIPEAIEVDKNNNLFFYGRVSENQTLAKQPVNLSDIAVIYRAIFHHGYNQPYISLDKHEDNRYAKVNFGGHLQNTHVGNVVLEADKLFKTLITGINPNTYEDETRRFSRAVPGFHTENDRRFLEKGFDVEESHEIRYWFYPDDIGVVTDGSIAAVQTWQFLADAERMDLKVDLDKAARKTINHLNDNYLHFEETEKVYQELGTVGRLLSLFVWLKETGLEERIELEDLLSVKLPAFTTPEKTKKMLTASAFISFEGQSVSKQNISDYTKTYNFSHLLDKHCPDTSDFEFLEITQKNFSMLDTSELYPAQYRNLKSKIQNLKTIINSNEKKITQLEREIERKRRTMSKYRSRDVNIYNQLIDEYNQLTTRQKNLVDEYNVSVHEINSLNIHQPTIATIGGGISLRPQQFRKPVVDRNSPRIKEVIKVKSKLKPFENVAVAGGWVRSNSEAGGARINNLP